MMDIFRLCQKLINEKWNRQGIWQVQVTALNLMKQGQADMFINKKSKSSKVDAAIDAINDRFGELALAPAKLINRSTMPNVIAPSWKPHGHRETILSGKYSKLKKIKRVIPFYGYIN